MLLYFNLISRIYYLTFNKFFSCDIIKFKIEFKVNFFKKFVI